MGGPWHAWEGAVALGWRFLAVTLLLSYALGLPPALASRGVLDVDLPPPLVGTMVYTPAIAALVLSAREGGRRGVATFLGSVLRWRVPLRWYAAALLLPPAVSAAGLAGHALLGGRLPDYPVPLPPELAGPAGGSAPAATYVALLVLFAVGSLGEELGWRGFALPRLQRTHGALGASLIIGVVWAVWHLPLFLMPGTSQAQISFAVYLPSTIAWSIVFTWVYDRSVSLLPPVLMHASIQASTVFLGTMPSISGSARPFTLTSAAVAAVAAVLAPRLPR